MGFGYRRPFRLAALLGSCGCLVALLVTLCGHPAWAQTTRTIKIVVPLAPGGGTDVVARLLAEQIGRAQRVTMIIENRPGAGRAIGTEAVARAAPDGNTLLFNTTSLLTTPHFRKLNYDAVTSFEPICHLVSSPLLIVVNTSSPYRTLADLLNAARAKPGELTLVSSGPAGGPHIAVEMFKRAANVNMTYVPYSGGAPAVNALLGEHVTSVLTDYPTAMAQLKSGTLRALASASRTRTEPLPDVPTVAESGYKDYEADLWNGVFAPAKTPKETVSQLAGWMTAALQVPEVKATACRAPRLSGRAMQNDWSER
jgi:tripartite-type tricarboxylate transporter receptor subunit TctC